MLYNIYNLYYYSSPCDNYSMNYINNPQYRLLESTLYKQRRKFVYKF